MKEAEGRKKNHTQKDRDVDIKKSGKGKKRHKDMIPTSRHKNQNKKQNKTPPNKKTKTTNSFFLKISTAS